MEITLFDHKQTAYDAAVEMMQQTGKAAIIPRIRKTDCKAGGTYIRTPSRTADSITGRQGVENMAADVSGCRSLCERIWQPEEYIP